MDIDKELDKMCIFDYKKMKLIIKKIVKAVNGFLLWGDTENRKCQLDMKNEIKQKIESIIKEVIKNENINN